MQIRARRNLMTGVAGLVAALVGVVARGDVSMPAIFGNHMVLQQGIPVEVWGWAHPGEKVTVTLSGAARSAQTEAEGNWRVSLPAQALTRDASMTVQGTNTITFEDVAVGEVWLCSGQSNMEMGVGVSKDAEKEIAAADFPDIRFIDVPKVLSARPKRDFEGAWVRCSPETVAKHGTWGGFSAAAYYFGRKIHQELGVPVGLIDSSWGGSRIEPWVPPVGFEAVPVLGDIAKRLDGANPSSAAYQETLATLLDEVEKWITAAKQSLAQSTILGPPPAFPASLRPLDANGDPAAMYNAMIHPLVPFGIKGAIWYQGESNHADHMMYVEKTRAQVEGWRKLWSNPELPYYYVQIAPWQYGDEPPDRLATSWEAQAAIEQTIPHTGMAVIHDVGDLRDIHPKNKQVVGLRLALLALKETYGRNVVCRGPLFSKMTMEDGSLRIDFDNAEGGLTTRDGKAPDWFEILGENGEFVVADARIEGESIVLQSDKVRHPVVARFMWNKLAEPNLMNQSGLPASAFRAGEIPVRAAMDANVPDAKDYELLYCAGIPEIRYEGDRVVYDVDRSGEIGPGFDRVAYFLEYREADGELRYVFVSLDPFSDKLADLGVPTFATKVHQQKAVTNLTVVSNVESVKTGTGFSGWIEFWPCNYSADNVAKVPGASQSEYDFGDAMSMGTPNGYGSMQIHNLDAKQVVFAYNNWKARGAADIGIGNRPTDHPDWTFSRTAGSRKLARILVLVHPRK